VTSIHDGADVRPGSTLGRGGRTPGAAVGRPFGGAGSEPRARSERAVAGRRWHTGAAAVDTPRRSARRASRRRARGTRALSSHAVRHQ
jgi:hypothetical protein